MHFFGPHLDARSSGYAIGVGALLAGLAQLIWALAELRSRGLLRPAPAIVRPAAMRVLRRFVPVAIGLGAIQLNALLDTLIAMWPIWIGPVMFAHPVPLDERSNAILAYSQRLYQFPLGVFGIAVATAAFPALSRLARDRDRFSQTLDSACRLSLFIALPASLGLVLVRGDLVNVMFGGSSGFSNDGLARSAAVLLGYAIAVWAYSLNHVLVRGFYARGDTSTPMRIALGAVTLNLVLNLILIWPMREAGLAWSTAISQIAQALILVHLTRRNSTHSVLRWRPIARICALTTIMGLCILALRWAGTATLAPSQSWTASLVRLVVEVALGMGVYALLAWRLRLPEFAMLLRRGPEADNRQSEDPHADAPL